MDLGSHLILLTIHPPPPSTLIRFYTFSRWPFHFLNGNLGVCIYSHLILQFIRLLFLNFAILIHFYSFHVSNVKLHFLFTFLVYDPHFLSIYLPYLLTFHLYFITTFLYSFFIYKCSTSGLHSTLKIRESDKDQWPICWFKPNVENILYEFLTNEPSTWKKPKLTLKFPKINIG